MEHLSGKDKKNRFRTAEAESFLSSHIGSHAARNQAVSTDEAIRGMSMLREMARKLMNVGADKKQGNLFEIIEATKFNMDAAAKGIRDVRASVTAMEGDPHAAADIIIRKGKQTIEYVQAKSSSSSERAVEMFRNPKYLGMQKLTNPEHVDAVREISGKYASVSEEHADTVKNVRGGLQLRDGSIKSKGTSHAEAMKAAEKPNAYSAVFEFKQIGKEMMSTGTAAAVAGGIVGGAVSMVKHGLAVKQGKISGNEAAVEVIKDAGKSGLRSGTVGVVGAGLRSVASRLGVRALTKSNVATAIAAGIVDSGVTVLRYAKGEITGEEAAEKIGETGVSTASGIYAGFVTGAAFGPIGAIIGSVAGFLVASSVYQSSMAILKNARLAEEEASRVMALCAEAEAEMQRHRKLFEQMMAERLANQRRAFNKCLREMDKAIDQERFVDTVLALERFNHVFGHSLKLASFEAFDRHMRSRNRLEL